MRVRKLPCEGVTFAVGLILIAVATLGCAPGRDTSGDGPLEDPSGTRLYATGLVNGNGMDVGDLALHNAASTSATIKAVSLISGGPSNHDFTSVDFFIAPPTRKLANGFPRSPSGPGFWGVKLEPAAGYSVPPSTEGSLEPLLIVRLALGQAANASFDGVQVTYEWGGSTYTLTSPLAVTLCAMQGATSRLPRPCR